MPEPSADCPSEVRDYIEYTSLMINVSRRCNLDCRLCYVDKSIPFDELSDEDILAFIERYRVFVEENFDADLNLTFCGHGELFCRPGFPSMIRALAGSRIRHICLITNGTIDRLDELGSLDKLSFSVSLDLPQAFHEWNREEGNFEKTSSFIRRARTKGARYIYVQSILTQRNYREALEAGVDYALGELGAQMVNLIPLYGSEIGRHGAFYVGDYDQDELCLEASQLEEIRRHRHADCLHQSTGVPPRYVTLYSDGRVFNCSDSVVSIGRYDEAMDLLFGRLVESQHCGFCLKRR